MHNYIRNCPNCNKIISYSNEKSLKKSINSNSLCPSCAAKSGHKNNKELKNKYIRHCPSCNVEIYYSSLGSFNLANTKNRKCMSCSIKQSNKQDKKYVRNCPKCNKEIYYKTENGKNYAENKNTLCTKCTNILLAKNPITQNKKRIAQMGENNHMYGKSTYDVWLQKYGKEEADKRQQRMIEKCKIASSGENNPMYGKPAPKGSGNGWSGYYMGHYFRSLLELHYLIYLIDNDIKFENGELKKHHIQYTINGIKRNYLPDYYLINEDITIEIKPKNLINSYENKLKFEAAKKKLGNKHIVLTENDIEQTDINKLWELYINGKIIFDKKYEEKFKNYYNNF